MRNPGTVLRVWVVGVVLASATNAFAQTVRYELDAEAPLNADGWTFIQSGATTAFDAGSLRLQSTKGFAEWMLRAAADKPAATTGWLVDATPGRGWWVEARVQITTASNCFGGGPGLWIDDGKSFLQLHLETSKAHFITSQDNTIAVSAGEFHVYRLQSLGGRHFQLLIDGTIAVDEPAVQALENGKALMFGDLGGCDASDSKWDYVAYDAFGPGSAPGDQDNDGVANALDNCVLLANADQTDADHDGVGDACDICPKDANNDQDNDGLCADNDPCPTDARNDQDKDGVCDTLECAPFQTGFSAPGTLCPAICSCRPFGIDPVGGFGNLDNFGGTYPGGMGGTGGARASAGANHGGSRAGSMSMGGSAGSNGDTQSGDAAPASDSAGCACRMHGSGSSAPTGWLALGACAALLRSRRARTLQP